MLSSFLSAFLIRYRFPLFIVSVISIVAAATQLPQVQITGDYKSLFDKENPQLLLSDALEDEYAQSEKIMIYMKVPDGEDVFNEKALSLIREFTEHSWQMPYSIRVDSLTNFQRTYGDDDSFIVEPLVPEGEELTQEKLAEIKAYALGDELLSQIFVSKRGDVASILVTVAMPDERLVAVPDILEFCNHMRGRMQFEYPGLEVHFNGEVMLINSFREVTVNDIARIYPAVFIVQFLILGLLLRSSAAVLSSVLLIIGSNVLTLAWFISSGGVFNPISMSAPIMVLILALADSIHLMTQYIIHLREGNPKVKAMRESLKKNILPIFLTSITTAIGFLGMNFGDSPSFRDLGNIAAVGVMVAFVLTLTMLPTVVLWLPAGTKNKPLALTPLMEKLSAFTLRQHSYLFWGALALVAMTVIWIPRNDLNDSIASYFDDSLEFSQAIAFSNEHMSSFQYLIYSLDSGQEGYVNEPEFLRKVEAFDDWIKQQPEVTNVSSYLGIIKNLNQTMHGGDPAWFKIPETRKLAAEYLLLYEMSLTAGQDMTQDVNQDRSALRMVVNLKQISSVEILNLEARVQNWFDTNYPELKTPAASRAIMFSNLTTQLIKSMVIGSLVVLLLITAVLVVGIGSWKYGLLSIIPNAFPAAVVYGAWGVLVGEVNQAAAMTFSISIGLVVDDTVHFLTKYIGHRKDGYSPEESIRYAYRTAGTAIVVTTFTLASGMFLLVLSNFTPNDTTAYMLCSIVLFALALDLFFLPGLLLRVDRFIMKWNKEPAEAVSETTETQDVPEKAA